MTLGKHYVHKKTGGVYELVAYATEEATMKDVVVYQDTQARRYWTRPRDEFFDGRFELFVPAVDTKAMTDKAVSGELRAARDSVMAWQKDWDDMKARAEAAEAERNELINICQSYLNGTTDLETFNSWVTETDRAALEQKP
mgnify:CR=1 FL=1